MTKHFDDSNDLISHKQYYFRPNSAMVLHGIQRPLYKTTPPLSTIILDRCEHRFSEGEERKGLLRE